MKTIEEMEEDGDCDTCDCIDNKYGICTSETRYKGCPYRRFYI